MKALVTGCAGFIGSHLTERLLMGGFDVIGIDCFTDYYPREYKDENIKNALEADAFTLIEQDIRSMDAFVGGGTRISVNDLIEVREKVTGRRGVVKYIEKQKGDVKDTLTDAVKIGKLGWKPRVGIEEGT